MSEKVRDKITIIDLTHIPMSNSEIETRLMALEIEVASLKSQRLAPTEKPWWEEILGSFAADPAYDEAMQIGRQYRESLRPSIEPTSEL